MGDLSYFPSNAFYKSVNRFTRKVFCISFAIAYHLKQTSLSTTVQYLWYVFQLGMGGDL